MIRLYTGPDGQSHAEKIDPKTVLNPRFGRSDSEAVKVSRCYLVRFPPGFVLDWHPASAHRYLITLSGQGEIEIAGGERIPLPPGSILEAADVTGKGHVTRTVGNQEWTAFFVEF